MTLHLLQTDFEALLDSLSELNQGKMSFLEFLK